MATKIRLSRFGRKKRPFYRIMVSDSRAPRDGRHVEQIGYFDPLTNPKKVEIDRGKALQWLDLGATPSTTVRNLFSSSGILLERELKKQGKPEEIIQEEIQKFGLLQELKLKNKIEKRKEKQKAKAAQTEAVISEGADSVAVTEAPAKTAVGQDAEVPQDTVPEATDVVAQADDAAVEAADSPTEDVVEAEPAENVIETAPAEEPAARDDVADEESLESSMETDTDIVKQEEDLDEEEKSE